MIKRVVIAGCRNYDNYDEAKAYIDLLLSNIRKEYDIVIISGGASGADALGERYAKENRLRLEIYPADWKKYGKAAGPKRNKIMAALSDYIICFWDEKSPGTKSMITLARNLNKKIKIKII